MNILTIMMGRACVDRAASTPMTERERLLKRFGLTTLKMEGEQAEQATELFEKRTKGMLDIALHRMFSFNMEEAIKQYGFDCYTQGALDGAQAAAQIPEILETIRTSDSAETS